MGDKNTISFNVPYDSNLSKNRRYAFYKSKFKNPKHKKAQELITKEFEKLYLKSKPAIKGKTIIKIYCYKKDMRGDISNFINPINDAIKVVLPYDDNYFINITDYEIDKENPKINISITYET